MRKQVDPTLSLMAKFMGAKGGSRHTAAQIETRKKGLRAMWKARGIKPKKAA